MLADHSASVQCQRKMSTRTRRRSFLRNPWRETAVRGDNDPKKFSPLRKLEVRFVAFCCDRTLFRRAKRSRSIVSRTTVVEEVFLVILQV